MRRYYFAQVNWLFIFVGLFFVNSLNAQITICSGGCPANTSIPDNGCPTSTTSTINVTGVGTIDGTFGLQQVCVYITHTWRSDIDMYLVAPDGTRVELSTDNGSSGTDFGAGCTTGQMLCFDAGAATSITAWGSTDPATGTYQPEGCLGAVNNGQNADGTWTLEVCDDAGGATGAIEGWCLVFDNNPQDPSTCPVYVNCPSADDCASAYVLTGPSGSLNFDLNGCTGDYDASCTSACGLDQVFQIDVPDGSCLKWWVSNDNFDVVGYTYINGCPGVGTEVTCSDNDAFVHQWTNNTGVSQTVYIVVDEWGSSTCTDVGTGTLNWEIVTSPTFSPDFVINTFPFTQTGTTCGAGNDVPDGNNSCNTSYDGGEDLIYELNITTAGTYTITVKNTDGTGYIGWFLTDQIPTISGCGTISFPACIASATSGIGDTATACVTLNAGTYYLLLDYFPSPTCSNFKLEISYIDEYSRCQMNYTITSIPYQAPPTGYLSGTSLKGTFDDPDDEYSNQWVNIPFSFCFDGNWYDSFLVADNGYIIFPTQCRTDHADGDPAIPGGYSPWNHDPTITWPCNNQSACGPFNTIAMIWRDFRLNGEGTDNTPNQIWDIRYDVVGTAPNRKFYIKFYEIPQYGTACREDPAKNTTGYIMLEEGTNAIEIHIYKADTCESWDDGLGITGLHSIGGQFAAVPPGYNNTPFTVSPPGVAWRFEPPSGCCNVLSAENIIALSGEVLASGKHKLYWTVLNNNPNDTFVKFKVYYVSGYDQTNKEIMQVPARKNQQDYSIIVTSNDAISKEDRVTYFIRGITQNGKVIKSNLVTLISKQSAKIIYYPNKKFVRVFANCKCDITVDVVDISGKVIMRKSSLNNQHISNVIDVDVKSLKYGIYYVKVYTEDLRILAQEKLFIY